MGDHYCHLHDRWVCSCSKAEKARHAVGMLAELHAEQPAAPNQVKDPATQKAAARLFSGQIGLNPEHVEDYEHARALLLLCHSGDTAAVSQALATEDPGIMRRALLLLTTHAAAERDRVRLRFTRKEDPRC